MATQLRPQPPVAPMLDASEIANIRTNFRVLHDRLVLLQDEYDRLLLREQRRLDADKAEASHVHDTADVTTGTFADARISESSVTQHEAAIDHDALTNFVAAEHIDWSVTGAEDVNVDRIAAGAVTQHVGAIDHNSLLNYAAGQHRTINDAGTGTTDLFSASEIISRLAGKATAPTSEDSIIAGADSQGDYPVTATFLHVATVDATGKSITLPAVSTTGWHFLANDGANSMNIYPASGEYLNAEAVNDPLALAAGGRAYFAYQSSGKWRMVTL